MIIETSAPTRIDLAGGTIDIWPLYLFHPGAQTLNAAISLRARARIESRADTRIVIRSEDTGVTVEAEDWKELRDRRELRLLSLLVHFFETRGITLTTSSQSPAGAGIAGSSALNVAVCAGLAEWNRTHFEPEALLQVAMNVEAQAIAVPTGLQDYRPALYGGIAALELEVDGVRRVPLDIDFADLETRIVLCYTGEPRNSGTNNWEITKKHLDGDRHVFDCFERIRDTAAVDARAPDARRLGRRRSGDCRRMGEPQAPGAGRDHAGDRRADRPRDGGRRNRRQGVRRRRRRVPLLLRPAGQRARRLPPRWRPAARACSTTRSSATASRVDNRPIAQVFSEIADLLEIKGENVFKIRAYRSAADTIAAWADPVARMDDAQLHELPGIGKDLAKKIRELVDTGACQFHQDLLLEFPPTILDLLRLQGVGPKTVALLYSALNIRSVDELVAAAARAGRLRELKGMGPKKEALILKAVEERQKDAGRHLLSDTTTIAAELVAYLRQQAPKAELTPVGSLRRGCETCGDIDILAVGADATLMEQFVAFPRVERVLGQGDTKSSVRILGGYQADLRLVPRESRGAAMQYFTGSKAHNVALRDRAIQHGLKLNEYGLFRVDDDSRVAGDTEEGIYEALGMSWVPPGAA